MKSPRQNKLLAAKVRRALVLAVVATLSLGCFEPPAHAKKTLDVRSAPRRVELSLLGLPGQTKTVSTASQRIRSEKVSRTVRETFYLNAGNFLLHCQFTVAGSERISVPAPLPAHMFVMPGTPPPVCLS